MRGLTQKAWKDAMTGTVFQPRYIQNWLAYVYNKAHQDRVSYNRNIWTGDFEHEAQRTRAEALSLPSSGADLPRRTPWFKRDNCEIGAILRGLSGHGRG
jgi:hypothetical protein